MLVVSLPGPNAHSSRWDMDRAKVEALIKQLEDAGAGWMGDAQREVSLRALRSESGQDLGADAAAWKAWLASLGGTLPAQRRRPPMSRELARILDALVEMGVVDEAEFLRTREMDRINPCDDLDSALSRYLRDRNAKSVWLQDDLKTYCGDEYEIARFCESAKRLFGLDTRVEIVPDETNRHGFHISLGPLEQYIVENPRQQVFGLLCEYSDTLTDGRQLWLDHSDRAWYLSGENTAAIRRHDALRLRKINRDSPNEPHADVQEALRFFDRIGARLRLTQGQLAWRVCEYDPEIHPRRYSYHAQLIDLADAGVSLIIDDFGEIVSAEVLTRRVAPLVGEDVLAPRRCHDLEGFVSALNDQLNERGSPWHVLAIRLVYNRCRLLPVPIDRVAEISTVTECIAGHEDYTQRSSGLERFSFGVNPTIEEVAPGTPTVVLDGECVDGAADYVSVINNILGLTAGEISLDVIECVEVDGYRQLTIAKETKTWKAKLHGETDYVDLEPLLKYLNKAAAKLGSKRRFVEFREILWGQEVGVAFVTKQEKRALKKSGHVVVTA